MMLLFSPAIRFACVVLLLYVLLPLYLGNALAGIPGLLSVAVGLLTALFWYGEAPRHAYSNIPGPPGKWLTGNLDMFIKLGGYHKCYEQVAQDYGRVSKVQMGAWTQILVQDPVLIKEIALEKFDSFKDRKFGFALRKNKGLLLAKGDEWHRSRRALNPAFNSIKLSAFAKTISRHCNALTQRLDEVLNGKKPQEPMNVLRLFGDLTMDVIGSTSFDAEFGLQQRPLQPEQEEKEVEGTEIMDSPKPVQPSDANEHEQQKKDVLEAAKTLFMTSSGPMGSGGKIQMFITVIMPFLGPLYKLLYPLMMTPEAKAVIKSIKILDKVMFDILDGRSQFSTSNNNNKKEGESAAEHNGPTSNTTAPAASVDANFIDLVRKATDPDSGIALDRDEVRDQLNLFVLAGYETTANTLAYTAFLLAQHPEVEAKLVEEIQRLAPDPSTPLNFKDLTAFTYTNNVINEALRLYPPGAFLTREAKETVTIGNGKYLIEKGSWIVIPVWSLHRDEMFWEKPLVFDPDRFNDTSKHTKYAHLPFGIGPRNCIGQRFALEEIKLALIAIYRNHTFQLHKKTTLPLKLKAGITLSPEEGIWMTVHHRDGTPVAASQ